MDPDYFAFVSRVQGSTLHLKTKVRQALAFRMRRLALKLACQPEVALALEIGASEASFSKRLARRRRSLDVVALEASPFVFERYRAAVEAARVTYLHCAASDSDGEVEIAIPRDFKGSPRRRDNEMASLNANLRTEQTETVRVPATRVDTLVAARKTPSEARDIFCWIDVEGAQKQVLSGMPETLRACRAVFIECETEGVWDGQWLDVDIAEHLGAHGLFPVLRDQQRSWQHNWLFASREVLADEAFAEDVYLILRDIHFAPRRRILGRHLGALADRFRAWLKARS